jgi:hypothetical protein
MSNVYAINVEYLTWKLYSVEMGQAMPNSVIHWSGNCLKYAGLMSNSRQKIFIYVKNNPRLSKVRTQSFYNKKTWNEVETKPKIYSGKDYQNSFIHEFRTFRRYHYQEAFFKALVISSTMNGKEERGMGSSRVTYVVLQSV